MKKFPPLFLLSLAVLAGCSSQPGDTFTLVSPHIAEGEMMSKDREFDGFGGSGKNISPALSWSRAPEGVKSFALTVYDPDAPTGSGWWHYVLVNIPASVTSLAENAGNDAKLLPPGSMQVRNDYGFTRFGGACPPVGDAPHRYIFKVHALKVEKLNLPPDATAALAGYMIHAASFGEAVITARYAR